MQIIEITAPQSIVFGCPNSLQSEENVVGLCFSGLWPMLKVFTSYCEFQQVVPCSHMNA